MAINWYDTDGITALTFPLNLGNFVDGESENKKIFFRSDDNLTDIELKIEEVSDISWKAFQIAKDFNGRPQAFADYLSRLYWYNIPAHTMIPMWIKFIPKILPVKDTYYEINLRMTGGVG